MIKAILKATLEELGSPSSTLPKADMMIMFNDERSKGLVAVTQAPASIHMAASPEDEDAAIRMKPITDERDIQRQNEDLDLSTAEYAL